MIIVSSCLAGRPCRYDGTAKPNEKIMRMVREGFALPVCAEELGGLQTPRKPCEIIGGDGMDVLDGKAYVQTEDGAPQNTRRKDVSELRLSEGLAYAKECGVKSAILKAKSPSCGCGRIYNGCFRGELRPGYGVTAALLERNGIHVQTEE